LYTTLLSPICATCSTCLVLLDFITWTILCKGYTSLSSSLCSFLHHRKKLQTYRLESLQAPRTHQLFIFSAV
jgi:hypothetical protein